MPARATVSLDHGDLEVLDELVRSGRFEDRAAALSEALALLHSSVCAEEWDEDLAAAYRAGYSAHPQDPSLGEAGLALMSEALREADSSPSA